MKRIGLYATVALFSLTQLGCVQHYQVSSVKTPDYSMRVQNLFSSDPQLLLEAPTLPYVVVGTIEVRASRSATTDELVNALISTGYTLGADAVIPPSPDVPRTLKFQSMNPYRVYYTFDDGSAVVLEGQAIRYTKK